MAAICSSSSLLFTVCNSSNTSPSIPKLYLPASPKLKSLKPYLLSARISAAPEAIESVADSVPAQDGASSTIPLSVSEDSDVVVPKHKIRIKLRSYLVPLIEDTCKQILDAAKTTNAKTMGPVPLPTKKRIYCVLKSPHVHKDARFHFEIRTHQRLIDILYPTAQTIDSLMQLELPYGVDVEVKL